MRDEADLITGEIRRFGARNRIPFSVPPLLVREEEIGTDAIEIRLGPGVQLVAAAVDVEAALVR